MTGEGVGLEGSVERAENEGNYDSFPDELLDFDGLKGIEEKSRPQEKPDSNIRQESPEKPESNCKKQKIDSGTDITEEPCLLGLILHKSSSFLDLIDMMLSQKKIDPINEPTWSISIGKQMTRNAQYNTQPAYMKWKASNFPATKLKIGSWERKSKNEGDIVAKFYYAKRKIVWEILEERLKQKFEIQWTDISAIRAHLLEDQPSILEVELRQQPLFFNEVNPQPRKHTNWEACSDFTGGNATTCRRHYLEFPQGILKKHYERLLNSDNRLLTLSQKVFPRHDSQFFETINGDMQDTCMLQSKFPPILDQPSNNWCSSNLIHINNQGSDAPTHIWTFESLDPSVGANYPLSMPKATPGVMQMNSPSSVMGCLPTMNQAEISSDPRISYFDNSALNNDNSAMNCTLDINELQIQQLPSSAYAAPAPSFFPQQISANYFFTQTYETENFRGPIQDQQSLEEQSFSKSDGLDAFGSIDFGLLSDIKAMGSLLYPTDLPDLQPQSSNG